MHDLAPAPPLIRTFFTFKARGRLYGLDVAYVREVSTHMDFTPVPQAPAIVRGLANLRSRIYLVLDAGPALGGGSSDCTADSRLIVLHPGVAENLGLLVDSGGAIVRVPTEQIEDAIHAGSVESPPQSPQAAVVAVCKLEGELMMVIDPARVLAILENATCRSAAGSETEAAPDGDTLR